VFFDVPSGHQFAVVPQITVSVKFFGRHRNGTIRDGRRPQPHHDRPIDRQTSDNPRFPEISGLHKLDAVIRFQVRPAFDLAQSL
jgi:hypothetical protein